MNKHIVNPQDLSLTAPSPQIWDWLRMLGARNGRSPEAEALALLEDLRADDEAEEAKAVLQRLAKSVSEAAEVKEATPIRRLPVESAEDDARESKPSAKLAAWRRKHGLSQSDLAPRLGCTRSMLSLWEQGRTRPSRLLAAQIEAITEGAVMVEDWARAKDMRRPS